MNAHATHTKQKGQRRYVPGSSRGRHSATTLLAQVADIERGQRIKARREELHLTQPMVIDLMEELAWKLPATHRLHPDYAKNAKGDESARSKPPVTLRGLQTWEAGGGIDYEKAKLLAQILQLDVSEMTNGASMMDAPTPDPFPPAADDERMAAMEARLMEQADIIRGLLETQNGLLARQSGILDDIRAATQKENAAADRLEGATDEAVDKIAKASQDAVAALRADAESRKPAARKPASKRSPKASSPKPG